MAIHQFSAGFTFGDAISNEALVLQEVFRSWGHESQIFSQTKHIMPEARKQVGDVADYAAMAKAEDIVLLHLSMGCEMNKTFAELPCRKAIMYHNITPDHFFSFVNPRTAHELEVGRKQVASLAGVAELNMAVSKFNARELEDMGYKDVKVLPLLLDIDQLRGKPDRSTSSEFDDGLTNFIFVGRCVPNKKIEDLITAFYYYQKSVDANARFVYVGSFAGSERYYHLLQARIKELGLTNFYFAGSVSMAKLNAFFQCADVFLCMSEHEGFCIPVIESMVHEVPVLSFAGAAVPETLDGSGVLFHEKQYDLIAEMMGRLAHDKDFRLAILDGQRARLERYTKRDLQKELRDLMGPLL